MRGFTIVELLIVVVVIAILAAIVVVSYNGITRQAKESSLKADLSSGAKQLGIIYAEEGSYPADKTGLKKSASTEFEYSHDETSFCLTATSTSLTGRAFFITQEGLVSEGACPGHSIGGEVAIALPLQTVTKANCPDVLTRAADVRDRHSYWVKKLIDGNCWMLTNLAYGGGGDNTYGDVIPVGDGDNGTILLGEDDGEYSNTGLATYYVHPKSRATTEPTNPSMSTDGGVTDLQYGYYYNYCAASGAQIGTLACNEEYEDLPQPVTNKSICPAGWRMPTGSPYGAPVGEYEAFYYLLDDLGQLGQAPAMLLTPYGGTRYDGFEYEGEYSTYWASTIDGYYGNFFSTGPGGGIYSEGVGTEENDAALNVRCIAAS